MRKRYVILLATIVAAALGASINAAGALAVEWLKRKTSPPAPPTADVSAIYRHRGEAFELKDGNGVSQEMAPTFDWTCGAVGTALRRAVLERDGLEVGAANGYPEPRAIPRGTVLVVNRDLQCP